MQSSMVKMGARPQALGDQFRREVARRIAWLRLLPVGIPAFGALAATVIIGFKLLTGLAIFDSLYNETAAFSRAGLVLLGMGGIIYATYCGYLSALNSYQIYFRACLPALRNSVAIAATNLAASREAGADDQHRTGNTTSIELLADIERQFIRTRRAQRMPLLPRGVISLRPSVLIIAVLALAGIVYESYILPQPALLRAPPDFSAPTFWQWARVALPEIGSFALLACTIALPTVLAAGYSARRIALYRVLSEDEGVMQALQGSSVEVQ